MKIRKHLKKGFTLVELVVVIAIIAILTGVGVAVYTGITNKAKITADSEIISQLNLQLKTKKAGTEGSNANCYEAYLDGMEIGFDLAKMKPQSGGYYVWDQEKDLFAVVDGNGSLTAGDKDYKVPALKHKLWKFVASTSETSEYSQFLTSKNAVESSVTVESGFDSGLNENVKAINYVNDSTTEKDVIIRTNSDATILKVTDTTDSKITQYGDCGILEAEVGMNSLYIEGHVNFVEAKAGHIVANGLVDAMFTSAASLDDVKVEGNVTHAHASSEAGATALNESAAENAVVWDYDGDNDTTNNHPDVAPGTTTIDSLKDEVAIEAANHEFENNNKDNIDDYAARIGKVGYSTLKEAISNANESNTVTLLKDVNEYNIYLLNGIGYCNYLNLNMNGHTISCDTTGQQQCIFKIWDATVNLTGEGLLLDTAQDCEYQLISMFGGDTIEDVNSCVLNVGPDITIQSSYVCVLFSSVDKNHNYGSVLNLYGKLYGCGPINVNGNVKNSVNCPQINIYSGSYIELNTDLYGCAGDESIYLAGYAKTTIYDGAKIVSLAGSACDPICISAGELYIKGGSIDAGRIVRESPGQYGAVDTVTGNAICVAQHSTNQGITVVIDGGEFTAAKPLSWQVGNSTLNPQNNVSITINGGTFNSTKSGYHAIDVEDTTKLPKSMIHINGGKFIENGVDVTSTYISTYGSN